MINTLEDLIEFQRRQEKIIAPDNIEARYSMSQDLIRALFAEREKILTELSNVKQNR